MSERPINRGGRQCTQPREVGGRAHCVLVCRGWGQQNECTTKSARTSSMVCRGSPLFCNQRRPSRCIRPSRLIAAAHVHRPGTISMGIPNRCQGRKRAQAAVRQAEKRIKRTQPESSSRDHCAGSGLRAPAPVFAHGPAMADHRKARMYAPCRTCKVAGRPGARNRQASKRGAETGGKPR